MANKTTQVTAPKKAEETVVPAPEQFYVKYKKVIWSFLLGVLAVLLLALGYNRFIYQPKAQEAMAATYPAEMAFQAGDYELAFKGDGNNPGFEDIISTYGSKSGKAVYLYAGICCLEMKDYSTAVSYLKKYDGRDEIMSARATSCLGDAYVGLEQYDKAVSAFLKAAGKSSNVFSALYLFKAGLCYEKMGEPASALGVYKQIKDKYPQSVEAYDIDKYIARVTVAE